MAFICMTVLSFFFKSFCTHNNHLKKKRTLQVLAYKSISKRIFSMLKIYKSDGLQGERCSTRLLCSLTFLRDIYLPVFILTKLRSKTSNKLANSVISSSPTPNTNCPYLTQHAVHCYCQSGTGRAFKNHYTCTLPKTKNTAKGSTRLVK